MSTMRRTKLNPTNLHPAEIKGITNTTAAQIQHLENAASAFHGNVAVDIVECREAEMGNMKSFMKECVDQFSSGLLYISGAPGTGKTFCVERLLSDALNSRLIKKNNVLSLNAAGYPSLFQILEKLGEMLGEKPAKLKEYKKLSNTLEGTESIIERIIALRKNKREIKTIVIDEVDQLRVEAKSQRNTRSSSRRGNLDQFATDQDLRLVKLFSLALFEKAKIFMIVIANSVNLMNDIEPRMKFFDGPNNTRKTIYFQPYTVPQLRSIVGSRLALSSGDLSPSALFSDGALELCIRKVAASHGDCRMVLDACRRTIANKLLAASRRNRPRVLDDEDCTPQVSPLKKTRLSPPDEFGETSTLPSTDCTPARSPPTLSTCSTPTSVECEPVGMGELKKVMDTRFGSFNIRYGGIIGKLPLHQQLLLCALLELTKGPNINSETMPKIPTLKLHEAYVLFCAEKCIPPQFTKTSVLDGVESLDNCGLLRLFKSPASTRRGKMACRSPGISNLVIGTTVQLAMGVELVDGALGKSMGAVASSYFSRS